MKTSGPPAATSTHLNWELILSMRAIAALCLCSCVAFCADSLRPQAKHGASGPPPAGVKTPGVQIPFSSIKPDLEFAAPEKPRWISLADVIWMPDATALRRIDPKSTEAKYLDSINGISHPCGGIVQAFGKIWAGSCGDESLVSIDAKAGKIEGKFRFGAASVHGSIAATSDSIWLLTDTKTTLSRIDPAERVVVAEVRLPAGCHSLIAGENSLWTACPTENKVLRINPTTNLVEKSIEVSAEPQALAFGEGSVWSLGRKEGKLDRIDPKLNKISKTIDLGAPGAAGELAVGEGAVWVTMAGFPITRVDPQSEKVAQQFYGEGGGAIQTGGGFIWLSNVSQGTVWKIDPRRIRATLAE